MINCIIFILKSHKKWAASQNTYVTLELRNKSIFVCILIIMYFKDMSKWLVKLSLGYPSIMMPWNPGRMSFLGVVHWSENRLITASRSLNHAASYHRLRFMCQYGRAKVKEWLQFGAVITWLFFLKIPRETHPIARQLRHGMGCLLCAPTLICILPQSLWWWMQYHVILDRVITAPDSICKWHIPRQLLVCNVVWVFTLLYI